MSKLAEKLERHGVEISDLDFPPSSDDYAPVVELRGENLVVGYLCNDPYQQNPLDELDCCGNIFHNNHPEGQKMLSEAFAIAFHSTNEIISQAVADSLSESEARDAWLYHAEESDEFALYAEEHWSSKINSPPPKFFKPYLRMMAYEEWQVAFEFDPTNIFVWLERQYSSVENIVEELWREKLELNEIGIFGAMPLEKCCSAGTVSPCGDYLEANAVWIPNAEQEDTINEHAPFMAHGDIEETTDGWIIEMDCGEKSHSFKYPYEALDWLRDKVEAEKLVLPDNDNERKELLARGVNRAATLEAHYDIELYNYWVRGEAYSLCFATLNKVDGKWRAVEYDHIGGYFGLKYAESSLKDFFLTEYQQPKQPTKAA